VTPSHEPSTPRPATTTRTQRICLDGEGILRIDGLPGCTQTREDAIENLAAHRQLGGGRARPLLVDLRRVRTIERGARECYVEAAPRQAVAVAVLVGSPLSRVIGNFFVGFNRPPVPTRLFTSEDEALLWLRGFVA
jgi:hypothetical protein